MARKVAARRAPARPTSISTGKRERERETERGGFCRRDDQSSPVLSSSRTPRKEREREGGGGAVGQGRGGKRRRIERNETMGATHQRTQNSLALANSPAVERVRTVRTPERKAV
jgi:hypothetical protein